MKRERCNVHHVTSMGQRNLSPQQKTNLRPSVHQSDAVATKLGETHGKLCHLLGSYTCACFSVFYP